MMSTSPASCAVAAARRRLSELAQDDGPEINVDYSPLTCSLHPFISVQNLPGYAECQHMVDERACIADQGSWTVLSSGWIVEPCLRGEHLDLIPGGHCRVCGLSGRTKIGQASHGFPKEAACQQW